jgi:gliding motility-associated-like protein
VTKIFFYVLLFIVLEYGNSVRAQTLTVTSSVVNATCSLGNGSISVSVSGGTAPYTYQWPAGWQNTAAVSGLIAGTYSVIITDNKGIDSTFTFVVDAIVMCDVTPEKFFTPNDDGINDTWYIPNSQFFENARVIVFDRWGTKVYEHKGLYESWDGKNYLGIPVPSSVYYYFFYQDKNDKQKNAKSGSVTIMR